MPRAACGPSTSSTSSRIRIHRSRPDNGLDRDVVPARSMIYIYSVAQFDWIGTRSRPRHAAGRARLGAYYLVEDGSAGYQASARITSNSYDRRDVRHLAAIEEHLPTYVLGNTCAVVSTMTNRTEGT